MVIMGIEKKQQLKIESPVLSPTSTNQDTVSSLTAFSAPPRDVIVTDQSGFSWSVSVKQSA